MKYNDFLSKIGMKMFVGDETPTSGEVCLTSAMKIHFQIQGEIETQRNT